jgi:hypothetical protein
MAEYLEAAARLVREDTSFSSSRSIFLSTDDPDIIDDIARGEYDHMNFTFYYTRYVNVLEVAHLELTIYALLLII